MSFENLKNNYSKLLEFLEKEKYSATVIRCVSREIKNILENAQANQWETYKNIYHAYEHHGLSKDVLRSRRHILRMIERYDVRGEFPDRLRRSYAFESDAYECLPDEFKNLIKFYRSYEGKRGKKETTIYHEALNAVSFLCFQQQRGCRRLDDITEKDVLAFFLSDDGSLARGCSYKKNISAVFKAGLLWENAPCSRILSFLPQLRESRKTIQYLTDEEAGKIRYALYDMENPLSLRDRAIGILLLYTGLRGCDIAGMQIDFIDWDKELLRFHQQKTGVLIELPLSPAVGNAIFDYMDSGRPCCADGHVFISEVQPYRRLASQSVANIALRIYKEADVRQNPGDRRGTHIFRHRAASHMLESGIPRPVISRTLGHTAPDSLEPYLMADFRHLKECSLDVGQFPVPEEVLAI